MGSKKQFLGRMLKHSRQRGKATRARLNWSQGACMLSRFSGVRLFATLWTVACQAPLSMWFSRQEYWSGLPCLLLGDLPDQGIKPESLTSPALAGRFFTTIATLEARVKVKVFVAQSYPILCNLMDYSPPGSSVHGMIQARLLEGVVIPFSRGSSWSREARVGSSSHDRDFFRHRSHHLSERFEGLGGYGLLWGSQRNQQLSLGVFPALNPDFRLKEEGSNSALPSPRKGSPLSHPCAHPPAPIRLQGSPLGSQSNISPKRPSQHFAWCPLSSSPWLSEGPTMMEHIHCSHLSLHTKVESFLEAAILY